MSASSVLLAAVCDGYGSSLVSEYLSATLPSLVLAALREGHPRGEALQRALLEADARWRGDGYQAQSGGHYVGGTTCTAALIDEGEVVVARVGDSPAFLSRAGVAVAMTDESLHTPSNDEEAARIKTAGGTIEGYTLFSFLSADVVQRILTVCCASTANS